MEEKNNDLDFAALHNQVGKLFDVAEKDIPAISDKIDEMHQALDTIDDYGTKVKLLQDKLQDSEVELSKQREANQKLLMNELRARETKSKAEQEAEAEADKMAKLDAAVANIDIYN